LTEPSARGAGSLKATNEKGRPCDYPRGEKAREKKVKWTAGRGRGQMSKAVRRGVATKQRDDRGPAGTDSAGSRHKRRMRGTKRRARTASHGTKKATRERSGETTRPAR